MSLINRRRSRPHWTLPAPLREHIERALADARPHLTAATAAELDHLARLVSAGQANPERLLDRLRALTPAATLAAS
ncbi:MAG: hypothetical protein IPK80_31180 [Nannocystis sp.]|nr:hypothetical protein [Nannocystis sp.]